MRTQREKEILKLIAEGYKNKEIADCLCVSIKTVDKHRTNLMKKLDLHNVSALTAFAIDKGLFSDSVYRPYCPHRGSLSFYGFDGKPTSRDLGSLFHTTEPKTLAKGF